MCFLSNASASANNFTPPLVKCTCRLQMSCIVQQKIAIEVKLAKHSQDEKTSILPLIMYCITKMKSCSTQQYVIIFS